MHRISPYRIRIGHAGDGRDNRSIIDLEIKAVVQLAYEEPPIAPPRGIIVERYPLLDGTANSPEILQLAIQGVISLIKTRQETLVCCGAGMSRSPAIVAAAISIVEEQEPDFCLEKISSHFPSDVSPGLWQDVTEVCKGLKKF